MFKDVQMDNRPRFVTDFGLLNFFLCNKSQSMKCFESASNIPRCSAWYVIFNLNWQVWLVFPCYLLIFSRRIYQVVFKSQLTDKPWTQNVNAEHELRTWTQIMNAEHELRTWTQNVTLKRERSERRTWTQNMNADHERRTWTQNVTLKRERRAWTQDVNSERELRT